MRARVVAATGTVDAAPLRTRETVLCETPTKSPICFMVRGRSARRRERPAGAAAGGGGGPAPRPGGARRRFLLGTAALGGLTVLAACSQASQPSPATGTQPTTSAPPAAQGTTVAPAVAGGGVTVTFWNGLTGADGVVMDGLLQQFGQE